MQHYYIKIEINISYSRNVRSCAYFAELRQISISLDITKYSYVFGE